MLAALTVAVIALLSIGGAPAAAQARPSAPVSADGLQASDGQRTLRVGQSQGLLSAGQTVGVSGSGYDTAKGIYVALCVVTPADAPPSPCGGGIDQTGETGASQWVSSNPPSYGVGLATPYGAGGSFSVNVTAAAVIAPGFDCRQIQCAIVSRNDHVRTADRSQDIFVPVTFVDEAPTPSTVPDTTTTTIAPPPAPTTTTPPPAPVTEVSADGRTGTVGGRSVTVSEVADLDPEATTVTVDGTGFDPAVAVQVTLCRAATDPAAAPAPCLAGASPEASKVVAPEGVEGDFVRFDDDGFSLVLEVVAVIDDETDCREADCVVSVRRFATGDEDAGAVAADRSLDLTVPVAFAAESPAEATTTTSTTEASADGADESAAPAEPVRATDADDGSPVAWVIGLVVGLAIGGTLLALWLRSRRPAVAAAPTPGDDGAAS